MLIIVLGFQVFWTSRDFQRRERMYCDSVVSVCGRGGGMLSFGMV